MAIVSCKVQLLSDIAGVWHIITNAKDYAWRSDVSKIEVNENGKTFVEYTKSGISTTFTITLLEPMTRYEFDMENKNMKGHWIGKFEENEKGILLDFTEDVEVQNPLMKLMLKSYLKKQQAAYIRDLKKALSE